MTALASAGLARDPAIALLRQMVLIRRFEEKAAELYTVGGDPWLPPPLHRRGSGGRRRDTGPHPGGCRHSDLTRARVRPERVRDTPPSESTFLGAGIGATLGGMRPIVEIMTVNLSLLAFDQIVNNAATLRHMSGGQLNVPLMVRMATRCGRQLAAARSHSLEGWFAHVPSITIRRQGDE